MVDCIFRCCVQPLGHTALPVSGAPRATPYFTLEN